MKLAAKALMFVMAVVLLNTGSITTSAKPAILADSAVVVSIRQKGTCKWWNKEKGFGMLTTESGEDVFCPASSLGGEEHRFLSPGTHVEFEVAMGPHGLIALNVTLD